MFELLLPQSVRTRSRRRPTPWTASTVDDGLACTLRHKCKDPRAKGEEPFVLTRSRTFCKMRESPEEELRQSPSMVPRRPLDASNKSSQRRLGRRARGNSLRDSPAGSWLALCVWARLVQAGPSAHGRRVIGPLCSRTAFASNGGHRSRTEDFQSRLSEEPT